MTRIVLATNNAKKLAELRRLVHADASLTGRVEVLGLADVPGYPEPAETAHTFEGNALLKARACVEATGEIALADDSGLEVDVLGGMPGVRSARWSGPQGGDEENLQLLLRQIDDVQADDRGAHFTCAMALVRPDGTEQVVRAEMPGSLATAPVGTGGFGYDPIFVPDGYTVTAAELSAEEKDAISHRGQAVRDILDVLRRTLPVDD